jgi:pimeloyl-ACP methyl ester carboxylesterase
MNRSSSLARCLATAIAVLVFTTAAAPGTAGFSPVGAPTALKGTPGVFENRFAATRGDSPFDRIALHRIAMPLKPGENPTAVMLYLPGTNMNGEVAIDEPHHNLIAHLAAKGIDTWSLDYRTHFIPPATPESNLAELKGWTNALFESDIEAAADFVLASTHRRSLFVAGFSRGVEFGYLYAANHPERVAGLVMLDGFISDKPMRSGTPTSYAEDGSGRHLTYEKRKHLLEVVIQNPDGPAPIPKYKTARENLEHVVYDSARFGGSGGLANPMGGFSDAVVLAHLLLSYDRWWPTIQDYENPITPALKAALAGSKIPVIAFASTNMASGWPGEVRSAASSTGSSDVTFKELRGWGHLDVLCGTKAESEVYEPAAAWITQHAK